MFVFVKQKGVTLVELMISLTLGIIVLGGGIQIFISGQQAYNEAQRFSRLQSDLSLITDFIATDVRGATTITVGADNKTLTVDTTIYALNAGTLQRTIATGTEVIAENVSSITFNTITNADATKDIGLATTIELEGAQAITFQVGLRNRILETKFGS
jgi:Tfp pilus assembly protein PilW